jgi:hypothetical protein
MTQGELFAPEKIPIEYWWNVCWNWPGPEVGGYCQVNNITAEQEDNGQQTYAYCLRCRILKQLPDGRYLVEVDNPGITWTAGRLLLPNDNIWPSVKDLRKEREDNQ